ncbi:MAG: serine hydrolase domain-containing protein [Candidatus Aquilonibacter sp.]
MKNVRLWLLALAILACLPARADDTFAPVRQAIIEHLRTTNTASVVVAVSRGRQIVWEEAFGWANREKRIRATTSTPYSLASDTKPLTATALMTLVEARKLDLDAPVNDYLGAAKLVAHIGDVRDATVQRVGNHSAGLPEHYQFFYKNEPWRTPSADGVIREYGGLFAPPGEHYEYSNLGYAILGDVIARVAREPFAAYLRQAVFLPLAMTRTSIGADAPPGSAVRYGDDGRPVPLYDTDHAGASSGWASVDDLIRFAMFNLKLHLPNQKPILTDADIDELHTPTMDEGNDNGDGYGLGWETRYRSGYRLVEHTGDMPGVAAVIRMVPNERIAVIVLCNAEDFDFADAIANQTLSVVLPHWQTPAGSDRPTAPPQLPSPLLGHWRGTISIRGTLVPVTLTVANARSARVRIGDEPETVVVGARITKDGYFRGTASGNLHIPEASRRPYAIGFRLKLRDGGRRLAGEITARADKRGVMSTAGWWPSGVGSPPSKYVQARGFVLAFWADLHFAHETPRVARVSRVAMWN